MDFNTKDETKPPKGFWVKKDKDIQMAQALNLAQQHQIALYAGDEECMSMARMKQKAIEYNRLLTELKGEI